MTSKHAWHHPKRLSATAIAAVFLLQTLSPAYATVLQVPATYQPPPAPNVMFTLDDSGSMSSDAIPDFSTNEAGMPTNDDSSSLPGFRARFPGMWKQSTGYWHTTYYRSDNAIARYLRSSAGNPLYYDPQVTYLPWPTAADNTVRNANANPGAVNIHVSNPFNNGFTRDLTSRVNLVGGAGAGDNQANNFWPATYYIYNGGTPLPAATPNTPLNTAGSFTKIEIKPSVVSYTRAANRTDCSGAVGAGGCTYNEELQNFANWLQYYRSRNLMAKGGVAAAFAQQDGSKLRVGFTTINSPAAVLRGVASFTGTARSGFFSDMYSIGPNGGTPLRQAMHYVGRYFQGVTTRGNPWAEVTSGSPGLGDQCRKSFHIMSTDGFWNGNDAAAPANANNDTFATTEQTPPLTTGEQFPYSDSGAAGTLAARFTVSPFRDNNANNVNTLADVAAYYWKTDLQPSLPNRLQVSTRDPAHWQHLTTMTVGLGISGSGQARPVDTALSSADPTTGRPVVSTALPATSPFYPYRGMPWLSNPALRDLLVSQRTPMYWPTTVGDTATTGDDLIHAAMNARGRYFSATNPTELATGLSSALAEATDQFTSFAALGLASTFDTSTDNRVYQALYNPMGWTGRLYAFRLNAGVLDTTRGTELWEASRAMPAPNDRNIFTWNPLATTPQGAPFTWSGLNTAQQAALGPAVGVGSSSAERQDVLEYLRGSAAREAQNGGPLRDRVRDTPTSGVLGDIVGGSPVRGPTAGGGYDRLSTATALNAAARTTYPLFRAAEVSGQDSPIRDMTRTLFFGANDGMLHAVNANDVPGTPGYNPALRGVERFAFVPNSVFRVPRTTYGGTTATVNKLYHLSRPDYSHMFTVNGPPQIADAYINPTVGNATGWKSVLLGSTGAGARSVFALDVTNPQVGSTGDQFNASKILWEFSESDHPDMGHMPSYPNVGLMRDGTWVAIVGNGYDSTNGQAKLFLLDLATGAVVWEQAVGSAGGNGLSQPNFLLNANREVIAIWAGDLRGNMWKFDVSSPVRSNWNVAYGGNPLFTTPTNQPITVMPELEQFPNSDTAMVIFGTGKLFDTQDTSTDPAVNVNLTRQAIYGIWDDGVSRVTALTQLREQTVLSGGLNGFGRVSENPIDWATQRGWYLRLGSGGERVNVNPIIPIRGRAVPVFVVANTPSLANDPCGSGGGGARVFALNPITGHTPAFSVFDANRDGVINTADGRHNVYSVAGLISSPRFLSPLYSGGIVSEKPGSRGQTGAQEGGVEFRSSSSGSIPCVPRGRMISGRSTTETVNEVVGLDQCKPRVSWRQIK